MNVWIGLDIFFHFHIWKEICDKILFLSLAGFLSILAMLAMLLLLPLCLLALSH